MNHGVDQFIESKKEWQAELNTLRSILLSTDLVEELKWKQPCYTFKGSPVAIIGRFKNACVLSFFKGVLLQDSEQLLSKAGENSQSARIIKFTSKEQIQNIEKTLRAYLFEAIEVEKAGLKVDFSAKNTLEYPKELVDKFKEDPALEQAFNALTQGRKRGYVLHFTAAKQSNTRIRRIEKYSSRIMDGYGINDCVCGLSKRMPNCDGSHKQLEK